MKSSKSKGKNNARTRGGLKPTSGGGAGVVRCVGVGSLCEGGKEEQGGSEGLLEKLTCWQGGREGKEKCGWVKGRLRWGGPCRGLHRDDWSDDG